MIKKSDKNQKWLSNLKDSLSCLIDVKLFEQIFSIVSALRENKKDKHNRFLPLGEYFWDRWARAEYYGFGDGSSVYDSTVIIGDVRVGKNTWIGPNVLLDGVGGLCIGDNCSISAGVQVYTHDSINWAVSGGAEEYQYESTNIGNNTYIGPNAIISKGVTIGSGCVVGAQSFVKNDVLDGQRVAGSPAKLLI